MRSKHSISIPTAESKFGGKLEFKRHALLQLASSLPQAPEQRLGRQVAPQIAAQGGPVCTEQDCKLQHNAPNQASRRLGMVTFPRPTQAAPQRGVHPVGLPQADPQGRDLPFLHSRLGSTAPQGGASEH